jgi:indole-3-glycerol phosphate synthase
MRQIPYEDLRAFANVAPPTIDFKLALQRPGVSLIAECKKASPSKGLIAPDYEPVQLATTYVRAGASAISVLTDARYFQGSLNDLRDVKEAILLSRSEAKQSLSERRQIPVLRKDFLFHPYQIYEARAAGADAVLLIASVLKDKELSALFKLTNELAMEALVEVHTEEELDRILELEPRIVGINNRNLQTFEVDFDNSALLRSKIPAGIATVAESGIKSALDVQRMRDLGFDAILVGEFLVRSKDTFTETVALVEAGLTD